MKNVADMLKGSQFRQLFFDLEVSAAALRLRDGVPGASSCGAAVRQYSSMGGVGSLGTRKQKEYKH